MKKAFHAGALQHYCQKSADGSVIFYGLEDYIVFITVFFHFCRMYGIRPRILCIMRNHFHFNAFIPDERSGSRLMMHVCSHFSRQYNLRPGVVDIKFKRGYSRSEKRNLKDSKSCDIYIGNNPVEKRACSVAREYRWNFLGYAPGECSRARPVKKYRIPPDLKMAAAVADETFRRGHFLTYAQVGAMLQPLSPGERDALTDHIIARYSRIDYEALFRPFGTRENYLNCMDIISARDYDIDDDLSTEDYSHYDLMDAALAPYGLSGNARKIREYAPVRQARLIRFLKNKSGATLFELSRYLHLSPEYVRFLMAW